MSTKIVIDGKYTWSGSLGCWFSSKDESSILQEGDVRVVRGMLFCVYQVRKNVCWLFPFFDKIVYLWVPVDESKHTCEDIRKFAARLVNS